MRSTNKRKTYQWHLGRSPVSVAHKQKRTVGCASSCSVRESFNKKQESSCTVGQSNRNRIHKNQGGTRSSQLTDLVFQLLTLAKKLNAEICPQYIPGIYHDVADSLSRQKSLSDWHLSTTICNQIFQKWGIPEVDLFASNNSTSTSGWTCFGAKIQFFFFSCYPE